MKLELFTQFRLPIMQSFCIDVQSTCRPETVLNEANEKFT